MKQIAIKYDANNQLHQERKIVAKSVAAMTKAELIVLVKLLAKKAGAKIKE